MLVRWNDLSRPLWADPLRRRGTHSAFGDLNRFRQEVNRWFEDYADERQAGWARTQLHDTGESLVLTAELPGVAKDDVELTVVEKNLTLIAKRDGPVPEGYEAVRRERRYGHLNHSVRLPYAVDADGVEAELKDGILTVRLPKATELRPRTIAVK